MLKLLATAAVAGNFATYPGMNTPGSRVEAVLDRGMIFELIVRCEDGTGIISFAKNDRKYCLPSGRCTTSFDVAVQRLCR
ncbi:MAG: hypothetical protein AAFQ44_02970 [Pseudomonadota bacterium]